MKNQESILRTQVYMYIEKQSFFLPFEEKSSKTGVNILTMEQENKQPSWLFVQTLTFPDSWPCLLFSWSYLLLMYVIVLKYFCFIFSKKWVCLHRYLEHIMKNLCRIHMVSLATSDHTIFWQNHNFVSFSSFKFQKNNFTGFKKCIAPLI